VKINSPISRLADLLMKELIMLAGVNSRIVTDKDMNKANIPFAILINKTSENNITKHIALAIIADMIFFI